MSREVRTFAEGALRWVQASATGASWTTASAAATGLIGFVQAGLAFPSARTVNTIMERGTPHHHKITEEAPIQVSFTYKQAVTANMPPTTVTAAGASVPAVHFELKSLAPEFGATSGQYAQFIHCTMVSRNFTEAVEGNDIAETWVARAVVWPTASGYIA